MTVYAPVSSRPVQEMPSKCQSRAQATSVALSSQRLRTLMLESPPLWCIARRTRDRDLRSILKSASLPALVAQLGSKFEPLSPRSSDVLLPGAIACAAEHTLSRLGAS